MLILKTVPDETPRSRSWDMLGMPIDRCSGWAGDVCLPCVESGVLSLRFPVSLPSSLLSLPWVAVGPSTLLAHIPSLWLWSLHPGPMMSMLSVSHGHHQQALCVRQKL